MVENNNWTKKATTRAKKRSQRLTLLVSKLRNSDAARMPNGKPMKPALFAQRMNNYGCHCWPDYPQIENLSGQVRKIRMNFRIKFFFRALLWTRSTRRATNFKTATLVWSKNTAPKSAIRLTRATKRDSSAMKSAAWTVSGKIFNYNAKNFW